MHFPKRRPKSFTLRPTNKACNSVFGAKNLLINGGVCQKFSAKVGEQDEQEAESTEKRRRSPSSNSDSIRTRGFTGHSRRDALVLTSGMLTALGKLGRSNFAGATVNGELAEWIA